MANLSSYIFLVLAIILGIASNGFLKSTNGFTVVGPTVFCVISIVACLFCLSKAMDIIPVGFTYATYGGLTITAVTLFGVSTNSKSLRNNWDLFNNYWCNSFKHFRQNYLDTGFNNFNNFKCIVLFAETKIFPALTAS